MAIRKSKPHSRLTVAQEEFAVGIASGMSQADAYRKAYPKALKWKNEAVWVQASQTAAAPNVRLRIDFLCSQAAKANDVTVERIVKELARIAFGRKRSLLSWGPYGVILRDSASLTEDEAAMVAEVSETKSIAGGSLKIKSHDKVKALELLGRHVGMFTDKVEMTGKDGDPLMPTRIELVSPESYQPNVSRKD